jgi:DNA-directed RNA polymerase subunit H
MHVLQSKHTKLSKADVEALLKKLNISLMQLPKIRKKDPALPENCDIGDVVKIERKSSDKKLEYFRVVIK